MFTFDHIIQNCHGKYYNGCAYGDERDWTEEVREGYNGAFGYTENGAYARLTQFPAMFRNCTIVKR